MKKFAHYSGSRAVPESAGENSLVAATRFALVSSGYEPDVLSYATTPHQNLFRVLSARNFNTVHRGMLRQALLRMFGQRGRL